MSQLPTKPGSLLDEELSNDTINKALFTYTVAEPRPGLEMRVLHAVAASSDLATIRRNPIALWLWSIAASSVVLAVVAFALWAHFQSSRSSSQSAQNNVPGYQERLQPRTNLQRPAKSLTPRIGRPSPARLQETIAARLNQDAVSRMPQRPPIQPTDQELRLAQLAANGFGKALTLPAPQPLVLAPLESHPIEIRALATEPIAIAPIRIAALQPAPNPAP